MKNYKKFDDQDKIKERINNLEQKNALLEKEYKKLLKNHNQALKDLEYYKKLAYIDALTGTYNRNYLKEKVLPTLKEKECYIGIADIDGLKQINDSLGNLDGDKIIYYVSNYLSKYGIVIRMGGDEFLIISNNPIEINGKVKGYTIASIFKPKGIEFLTAYQEIDKKMYKNKKEK
jgi:GGDEF domain-containing protein